MPRNPRAGVAFGWEANHGIDPMKLYYTPGACSLADHIALHEAGLSFDLVKVDLRTKTTEGGDDYKRINPKGYVPALELDDGEMLTENIAILAWIADQHDRPVPGGPLGRYRLLETLAFISTEIHKAFKPFFRGGDGDEKADATQTITARLGLLADHLEDNYLFGSEPSVADAYLFTMLTWCRKFNIEVAPRLSTFEARMRARPAVETALRHEGLLKAEPA